ncbi:MAG: DNA internalization-related competence protein ComEC/Rec2 [Caldisericia bacterium]
MKPAIVSALGTILGVIIGLNTRIDPLIIISISLILFSFVILPIKKLDLAKFFIAFLAISFILSSFSTGENLKKFESFNGSGFEIRGTVTSIVEFSTERSVFHIKVLSSKPVGLEGAVLRCYTNPAELKIADEIELSGTFYIAKGASNPGQFDFNKYLESLGIPGYIKDYDEPVVIKEGRFSLKKFGLLLRERATSVFSDNLPDEYSKMLSGMTFGKRALPEEIESIFTRSGTSHILAASGFHISIIIFSGYLLVMYIFGNKKIAIFFGIGIAILFALIVGFTPSITRAFILAILTLGGMLLGRTYSKGSGLACAVIIILLLNPRSIYSIGFQLSFVSSFALFIGYPIIHKRFKNNNWYSNLMSIMAVSILINILTIPILAYHFHYFSLVSPIANIIAIPVATILIPMGAIASILGVIIPPLGAFVCWLSWPLLILLKSGLKMLSTPLWAVVSTGVFPILLWIPYYVTVALLYLRFYPPEKFRKQKFRKTIQVMLVIFISFTTGMFIGKNHSTNSEVHFLDVGHGDCCFIITKEGTTMLIDAGGASPYSTFNPGSTIVVPFLRQRGINKLDYVIETHQDQDHIGGMYSVLSEFPVETYIKSGIKSNTFSSEDLSSILIKRNQRTFIPEYGQTINLDSKTSFTFFGPPDKETIEKSKSQTNDGSVAGMLEIDGVKIFMTGDIHEKAMRFEIENFKNLSCDIVKIPHHGGWNNMVPSWFAKVNPRLAINSDSAKIGTGANLKTEKALEKLNIPVLSTANYGAISIIIDDDNYTVETFK